MNKSNREDINASLLRGKITENLLSIDDFAKKIHVTNRTVSRWLKEESIPARNISRVCDALNISQSQLLGREIDDDQYLFQTESFFNTSVLAENIKATSLMMELELTYQALDLLLTYGSGKGIYRKGREHDNSKVEYIYHPLCITREAMCMNLCQKSDDMLLATLLLHDLKREYKNRQDNTPDLDDSVFEFLPVESRQALNLLYIDDVAKRADEKKYDEQYYNGILKSRLACLVKGFDWHHNLMTAGNSFSDKNLKRRVVVSQDYIYPLLDEAEKTLEFQRITFLLRLGIMGCVEILKRFLRRQ